MPTIKITASQAHHAEQQNHLMHHIYDVPLNETSREIIPAAAFRHHLTIFPEGQFVALLDERVIGFTVSMLYPFDPANPLLEPWYITIDEGWCYKHDPASEWMYGVESSVHPDFRSRGVGGKLMEARYAVARDLNLRGMIAGSGLISYQENVEKFGEIAPHEYIQGVVEGRFYDTNLTKQLKKGFRPVAPIPNYLEDPNTLGWGAFMAWDNPAYDPQKGRGIAVPRTYEIEIP